MSNAEKMVMVPFELAEMAIDAFASIGMHDELDSLNDILAQPASQPNPEPVQAFRNCTDARGYIADLFKQRLRRHDFNQYITERLAGDFAFVLANWLVAEGQLDQRQGEPVALPERKEPTQHWVEPGGAHKAEGWNACLDEIDKLGPLYTHPAQGEPVAWRFVEPGDEFNGYQQKVRVTLDKPSAVRARLGCEPLYTHADPAEVERLRETIWYFEAAHKDSQQHVAKIEAQLAEAHAMLREVAPIHHELPEGLRERIEIALSASAEPSAPKCKCDMRTKLVGDGCATCNPERAADLMEPSASVDERNSYPALLIGQTGMRYINRRRSLPYPNAVLTILDNKEGE